MPRAALIALGCAISTSACTFQDGEGFATLEAVTMTLELVPGEARDLGMQTILSDRGYAVHLQSAKLFASDVVLEERSSSSAGASFDPQNPPPGYSSCHGGHCHADDGRLVPYEEIEAEIGAPGAGITPIASLPVAAPVDLWSGVPLRLSQVEPSRELPRAEITRVSIDLESIELSGDVRPEPADGSTPVPLSVRLPIDASISAPLGLTIDRDRPGEFALELRVVTGARLVDGIDYATLISDGAIVIDDLEQAPAQTLVEALLASSASVVVR